MEPPEERRHGGTVRIPKWEEGRGDIESADRYYERKRQVCYHRAEAAKKEDEAGEE